MFRHFLPFELAGLVLLAGCCHMGDQRELAIIAKSLKSHVSKDDAREIALGDFDKMIRKLEATDSSTSSKASDSDIREELRILRHNRDHTAALLQAFLARVRPGDEIWTYRTYAWPPDKGGESGFAIKRMGKVIANTRLIIFD